MRLVEINKRLYAAGLKWYQIPPQKKVTLATLRASIRKEAESMGDNEASDMAALRPLDMEEFLQVSGVGRVKAERYGEAFLKAIRDWRAGVGE